jgi:SEC-C motif
MSLAPRNAPCPCGSGRKFKRCCGADRVREEALEARLRTDVALALVALRVPRAIPVDKTFEEWADAFVAGKTDVRPRESIALLPEAEKARLLDVLGGLVPPTLSAEASGRQPEEVAAALLLGAVGAGIADRRRGELDVDILDLIGTDDPLEDLALAIGGECLWEWSDGEAVARELALIPDWVDDDVYDVRWVAAHRALAERLRTGWHEARLELLVRRVEEQLPVSGFPAASAALAEGCRRFAADGEFRAALAAALLSDVLPRPDRAGVAELLAA